MALVYDRNDPRLEQTRPDGQQAAYLVLPPEQPFIRPVRRSYIHVGPSGPRYPLQDLTPEQQERYEGYYTAYEAYPEPVGSAVGRFWTAEQLQAVDRGCKSYTTMAQEIAETYAQDPRFYGSTFCLACGKHLPVNEFIWADGSNERVGS